MELRDRRGHTWETWFGDDANWYAIRDVDQHQVSARYEPALQEAIAAAPAPKENPA